MHRQLLEHLFRLYWFREQVLAFRQCRLHLYRLYQSLQNQDLRAQVLAFRHCRLRLYLYLHLYLYLYQLYQLWVGR
jgi:hypothetical protein